MFTVEAAGVDIWDTADQFHFVYRQMLGDVDFRARVDSISAAHYWSKAGVMIRGGLTADAAHAFVLVSADRGAGFQRRTAAGALSAHTDGPAVHAPQWVRIVRVGSQVTAYSSADGSNWSVIGTDTVALGSSVYVGLAVTSHNTGERTTARISNVTAAPLAVAAGQLGTDIGGPAIRGSSSLSNGAYTITAGGIDIWDRADEFHYVYQPVQGDVTVTARVASITKAHVWSKAGVMIRETLDAGSAHAYAMISAGRGSGFQRRASAGAQSEHTQGSDAGTPGWVRLVRTGSVFESFVSPDSRTWTRVDRQMIGMASAVYVGIAVTSHNERAATTAVVDNVQIAQSQPPANQPPAVSLTAPSNGATYTAPASMTVSAAASDADGSIASVNFYAGSTLIGSDTSAPYAITWQGAPAGTHSLTAVATDNAGANAASASVTVTVTASETSGGSGGTLPSGQSSTDVGGPAVSGSASYSSGAYTIRGAGVDIWGASDQFHFVHQLVQGDVTITARVASLTRAENWSKAGVMIRESLTGGSRHAFSLVSAASGLAFQRRPDTGGQSEHTSGGSGGAPRWVRLVRTGSVFESYSSTDGQSWTRIGSRTISMGSTVYVGLAVTSQNRSETATAVIDSLDVSTGQASSNQPPSVSLTSPANGASFTAPATLTVAASATDSDGTIARVDFYAGTTLIGTDTTSPYAVNWQNVAAGSYTLTAVARDDDGATRTSAGRSITVTAATTSLPTGIVFTASADHAALVTSYRLEIYASGATPGSSTPIATSNLGKPVPASNGDISVALSSFFQGLGPGNYIASVAAIGSGGTARSGPVSFTR